MRSYYEVFLARVDALEDRAVASRIERNTQRKEEREDTEEEKNNARMGSLSKGTGTRNFKALVKLQI